MPRFWFLIALLVWALPLRVAAQQGGVSSVVPAQLAAAVAAAKPGQTIRVSVGTPANVIIRNHAFAPPINIVAADPNAHPLLNGLQITSSSGINFANIDVTLSGPVSQASPIVAVNQSTDVTFTRMSIQGIMDPAGKCGWFGKGLVLTGSQRITFDEGALFNLYKGLSLGGGSYYTLRGSELQHIDTSAIDGGGDLTHLQFLSNHVHDMVPVAACGQHYDGAHLWSKNSKAPIDDVVFDGNVLTQAGGNGSSGLNLEGTLLSANRPGFTNVVISRNTFRWNSTQGISTNYVQAALTDNLLAPTPVLDNIAHAPRFITRLGSSFEAHRNVWTCGNGSKPYPDNRCLTAAQIAQYGGMKP